MASKDVDTYRFKDVIIEGVVPTNEEVGRGAYGKVFIVKYCGLMCAAKEIHPILIEGVAPEEKKTIVNNFLRECYHCSVLRHPNIVQFLGIYFSVVSDLPIMVMELMKMSLTSFVQTHQSQIALQTKILILYDVSLGLSYLHGQNIIHRDLSPNNVMLTSQLVAKIGDLGVAKVLQPNRKTRRLSKAPGTIDFMPPETLDVNPVYGTAVDVFSFAGIALFVFAEEWPTPSGHKRQDPATKKLVAITEVERRQNYIEKIPKDASILKELLDQSLHDNPDERPPIQEISEMIQALKLSDDTFSFNSLSLHGAQMPQKRYDTLLETSEENKQTGTVIKSKEECPLLNHDIQSKRINHTGGELLINDYMISIQIPENAVSKEDIVLVEAAASFFGHYEISDDYKPVSAYLWLRAKYTFKKQVKITIPHYAAVSTEDDKSAISVLVASEEDTIKTKEGKVMYEMQEDNSYDYEVEGAFCVYRVQHFCSNCLVKKKLKNLPDRIVALHYFPKSKLTAFNIQTEVCFCYDIEYCKTVVEKHFSKRGMMLKSAEVLSCTCDDRQTLQITYSVEEDTFGWKVSTRPTDEIPTKIIDFRKRYTDPEELRRDEIRKIYPPRFVFDIIRKKDNRSHLIVEFVVSLKEESKNIGEFKSNFFIENKSVVPPIPLLTQIPDMSLLLAPVPDMSTSDAAQQNMPDRKLKLFISYGREEVTIEFAKKLHEYLKYQGYEPTLDTEDFLVGDSLSDVISTGIANCDAMILILSQKYSKSQWCKDELKFAKKKNKKFFIIMRQKNCDDFDQVDFQIGDDIYLPIIGDDEYDKKFAVLNKSLLKHKAKLGIN